MFNRRPANEGLRGAVQICTAFGGVPVKLKNSSAVKKMHAVTGIACHLQLLDLESNGRRDAAQVRWTQVFYTIFIADNPFLVFGLINMRSPYLLSFPPGTSIIGTFEC